MKIVNNFSNSSNFEYNQQNDRLSSYAIHTRTCATSLT